MMHSLNTLEDTYKHTLKKFIKSPYTKTGKNFNKQLINFLDLEDFYLIMSPFLNEKNKFQGYCVEIKAKGKFIDLGYLNMAVEEIENNNLSRLLNEYEKYLAFDLKLAVS